jgi:hypothetical protein
MELEYSLLVLILIGIKEYFADINDSSAGNTAGHVVWVYCSLTCALFLVRTVKRILFQESNQYGMCMDLDNWFIPLEIQALSLRFHPFLFLLLRTCAPSVSAVGPRRFSIPLLSLAS